MCMHVFTYVPHQFYGCLEGWMEEWRDGEMGMGVYVYGCVCMRMFDY